MLPYYRKLENDLDFTGELHGATGPVPIRRTKPEDWAPLSKAVHAFAQERQMPFIADMNADFRDGYGAVPMSNWPHKRASAAICYLDAAVRARNNLTIINRATATGLLFDGRRVTGVSARIDGAVREFARREMILSAGGVHSPAFLMRSGIGPAGAAARARHRGARGSPRRRARIFEPRHYLRRPVAATPSTAGRIGAAAPDDGVPLFLGAARRAAGRHVHQRPMQDVVERARLPGRQSGADPAQADGARPGLAARRAMPRRPASNSISPATSSICKRFMQGFRRSGRHAGARARAAMSGVTFPVKFNDRLRRLNRINTRTGLRAR